MLFDWSRTDESGFAPRGSWIARIATLALIVAGVSLSVVAEASAQAQTIRLQWDWNTEPDVTGYVVYVGTRSREYDQSFDVGNIDRFSFTQAQPGQTYYFAVRAYFQGPVYSAYSAEVSAGSNAPPHLTNPGNQAHDIGQTVTLQLQGGDPQGQAVNYDATGLPPGLLMTRALGRIDGVPTSAGVYNVVATVSDGSLTASQSFTWTIRPASNVAPTLGNPGNQTSDVNQQVSLQLQASDAPGQSLAFSAVGLPPGLSISSSGRIAGAASAAGTFNVAVSVSDGALVSSVSFTWTVRAPNAPPVLANPGPQSGRVNEQVVLQLQATDAPGQSLTFSANGLPAGLTLVASTGRIAGAPSSAGVHTVVVTASDGQLSASETFAWTILAAAPPDDEGDGAGAPSPGTPTPPPAAPAPPPPSPTPEPPAVPTPSPAPVPTPEPPAAPDAPTTPEPSPEPPAAPVPPPAAPEPPAPSAPAPTPDDDPAPEPGSRNRIPPPSGPAAPPASPDDAPDESGSPAPSTPSEEPPSQSPGDAPGPVPSGTSGEGGSSSSSESPSETAASGEVTSGAVTRTTTAARRTSSPQSRTGGVAVPVARRTSSDLPMSKRTGPSTPVAKPGVDPSAAPKGAVARAVARPLAGSGRSSQSANGASNTAQSKSGVTTPDKTASLDTRGADSVKRLPSTASGQDTNTLPVVAISTPTSSIEVKAGTPVILTATAHDAEDGDLARTVAWTSSRDGRVAVGSSTHATLSPGIHRLTATVTDARGASSQAVVVVTVTGSR